MRFASAVPLGLAAAAVLAAPGCVERKLVVRSDPPGAVLRLEDGPDELRTPAEIETPWDGVRRVTLSAPGHEVLETTAEIRTRWFDYFPLDVFAEFFWPGTIRDVQEFDFALVPYRGMERQPTADEKAAWQREIADLRARADAARAGEGGGPPPVARTDEPPPPPAPRGTAPPSSAPAPAPAAPRPAKAPPRTAPPATELPPLPQRPPADEPPKPTPPGQELPPPPLPPEPKKL